MEKLVILIVLIVIILYSSAQKIKKNRMNFDDYQYPRDIVESVHSNSPEIPEIKIRLANSDEENDDDATITMDLGSEEEEDDDDDDRLIRGKKLSKSKTEDIHSFF